MAKEKEKLLRHDADKEEQVTEPDAASDIAHARRASRAQLNDEDESGGEGARELARGTSAAAGPVGGSIVNFQVGEEEGTTIIMIDKGANKGIVEGMHGHVDGGPSFVITSVRSRESFAVVEMDKEELRELSRRVVINDTARKRAGRRRGRKPKGLAAKITRNTYPDLWIDKGSSDGVRSGMKVRVQFANGPETLVIDRVNEDSCSVYWDDEFQKHGGYPVSDDVIINPRGR